MTTALIPTTVPPRIRSLITVSEDEHWQWTGRFDAKGVPVISWNVIVKPQIWLAVTGETLHTGEAVWRTCDDKRCVNPDHHEIRPAFWKPKR